MHDLAAISELLVQLFQTREVPEELITSGAWRSPLDAQYCVQLRFQPRQQCWLLGVDQSPLVLEGAARAQIEEALLRVAHTSRWTTQQVGVLDAQGRISLVDCEFPGPPHQAAQITAQAIEARLRALLNGLQQLSALAQTAAVPLDVQASAIPPESKI